jgi:hypothetical protein
MAQRDDLDLKIRALVEGTREVQQLQKEVQDLQGQARRDVPDNTSRFRRGMRQARDAAKRASREVFSLRSAMVALGTGAAAAAAVQRSIASTAAMSEQADAANVSAERFQELTKAMSDMAGVAEDTTGGALRRFNRRLGLARQGSGAAADTFDRLGISLQQETGPALDAVIEKLVNMEDDADRAAAASRLFGEDAGPKVAAALAQGEDALRDTITQLREQGRVMSNENAEAARRLNDRYEEITDTLSTGFKRAVVGATQALADLFNAQSELPQIEEELSQLREKRDRLLDNLDDSPWPDQLRDRINKLNDEMRELQKRREEILNRENGDNTPSPGGGDNQDPLSSTIGEFESAPTVLQVTRQVEKSMEVLHRQQKLTAESSDQLTEAERRKRDMMERGAELMRENRTATERYRDRVRELNRLLDAGAIDQKTYNAELEKAQQQLRQTRQAAEDTDNAMSEFARSAAQNMQSEFADALVDTEKGFEELADTFAQQLERMVAEAAAANLMEALLGEQGGALSGQAEGALGRFFASIASSSTSSGDVTAGTTIANQQHEGGMVGTGPTRAVPSSVFAGAPRLHRGGRIGPDEVPIVAQRGERVLSREQNAALEAGAGRQAPPVRIEFVNKGTPQEQQEEPETRFDGEGFVVRMLLKDQKSDGPVTRGFAKTFGLQRGGGR